MRRVPIYNDDGHQDNLIDVLERYCRREGYEYSLVDRKARRLGIKEPCDLLAPYTGRIYELEDEGTCHIVKVMAKGFVFGDKRLRSGFKWSKEKYLKGCYFADELSVPLRAVVGFLDGTIAWCDISKRRDWPIDEDFGRDDRSFDQKQREPSIIVAWNCFTIITDPYRPSATINWLS